MAFRKGMYVINGVERMVVADVEKETVADVLRRIGLTGLKIGCGVGQCGACTVLIDGKPVRACVKKWAQLPEFTKIETIEGMGTAANPHPLQLAWIKYGGVQCGYCTPGFIVSAKGLLDVNPSPTRKEVRDWFTKNNNLCRCTGYKQLVDAVMAAAEVMRGEKPIESLKWEEGSQVYNARYPRPTALAKVLGLADYGYDMSDKMPDGTLQLAVTWSTEHHAKILKIDTSEAEKMPGVEKVILAGDVKGTNNYGGTFTYPRCTYVHSSFPVLSSDKVMRLGAAIALVAADTEEHARAAAAKVKVDYEPLPVYQNVLEAVVPDAQPLHDGAPSNLIFSQPVFKGEDTREIFEKAEAGEDDLVEIEASFASPREPHLAIEPSIAQAYFDEEGKLTIHCKTQWIFANKGLIAAIVGMDADKVRVVQNNTGGAFGSTMCPDAPALCAVGASVTGKAVALNLTYAETMRLSGKRPPAWTNAKVATNKKTGKLEAMDFHNLLDIGGYLWSGPDQVVRMACLVGINYQIPNIRALMQCGLSNQPYNVAYRSWGCPEVMFAGEVLMDMAADSIGMDRFDFRYNNVVTEGDTDSTGGVYRNYTQKKILDMVRPDYEEAKKWKAEPAEEGWKRGIGVCLGGYHVSSPGDVAAVDVALNPDGSVTVYHNWEEMGQCSDVGSFIEAYEALKPLGIREDQIHIVMNDSDIGPDFGCAAGSRCHLLFGIAVKDAADKLCAAMKKADGSLRTYDEMKAEGIAVRYTGNATVDPAVVYPDPNLGHGNPMVDHNNVVYVVEVEVQESTGKVRVVKVRSAADVGVVGNYNSLDGQAIGGLHHSIGIAITEDYSDNDKRYTTPLYCGFLRCNEMPDDVNFEYYEDNHRAINPFGSGGASEAFQSSAFAGVISAINDATGVWVTELPAKPDKIKAALEAKAAGQEYEAQNFYLGCDMDETLDDILANPV